MSFIEMLKEKKAPRIVNIGDLTLSDGKPAQVKCRSMVAGDFMVSGIEDTDWTGIPTVGNGDSNRELSPEERDKFYAWLTKLVKRAVFAVRNVGSRGEEQWIQIKWVEESDGETPRQEGEFICLTPKDLEHFYKPAIAEIGLNIVEHANFGGDMADMTAGFRRE